MKRFYIVPLVPYTGSAPRGQGTLIPKYFQDSGVKFARMRYGLEDTALVGAEVTAAQHAQLAARPDVTAIPEDLDSTVGTAQALSKVQAELEALKLPADWVNVNHTYRYILRMTGNAILLAQKVRGIILHGGLPREMQRLLPPGITLDHTYADLTDNVQSALIIAANYWGIDYSGMTMGSTVRQILKRFGEQMPTVELFGEII